MATERLLICQCEKPKRAQKLFETFHHLAKRGDLPVCRDCKNRPHLRLTFPFELGAGSRTCEVLAAFLPRRLESWREAKTKKLVTFFPFLVVLKQENGKRTFWLPYWHEIKKHGKPRHKYGQWAPFMSESLFISLVSQARKAGVARTA